MNGGSLFILLLGVCPFCLVFPLCLSLLVVISSFRSAPVCHPAGPEEPHGAARRKLLGEGQRGGHQLHHSGLEGVHV